MHVGSPISSVIPSVDGGVLEVLVGTSMPLNLSTVHRLSGRASLSGVRRVLLRLVEAGVVFQVPGGYVLNREHVATAGIVSLARQWTEVLERMRRHVEDWADPPRLLGLFGSAARRDGGEESDVDVLLVSDAPDAEARAAGLAQRLTSWTGNAAHVVTLSTRDLRRMRRFKEPVLDEWDRDLVVVTGDRMVLKDGR